MKGPTPPEVLAAVDRLKVSQDFQLVYSWVAHLFDKQVQSLITQDPSNETFISVGASRAFRATLTVLQGTSGATTQTSSKANR